MIKPPILKFYTLNESQAKAALARKCDVVVTAGAGTGKTRTLVARYLTLLHDGLPPRSIAAITFTRKAAQEMRNRVRSEMQTYLAQESISSDERDKWQARVNQLDAARIGTIHQLCGEILRTHPAEAGLDPRFEQLDETEAALLKLESMELAMGWAAESVSAVALFDTFSERDLTNLLKTLLAKRHQARHAFDAMGDDPLSFWQTQLARAQQAQLDTWQTDPDWQAAIQTLRRNQATNPADKMDIQRLQALTALEPDSSLAGTVRNLALLNEITKVGGSQKSWPNGADQLAEIKEALTILRDGYRASPLTLQINHLDEQSAALIPALRDVFDQLTHSYHQLKKERNALDFDDLERLAIDLLATHPNAGSYWQTTIQSLLVDEFQDTNAQQLQLVELLCPDPGKLFIVGDAKQSIYRFRQADVAVFHRKREAVQANAGTVLALENCYRTHALLGNCMNFILPEIMGLPAETTPSFVAPFEPLHFPTLAPKNGQSEPFIETHLALGSKGDGGLDLAADGLAARLHTLKAAGELNDWGDVAILCRASGSFSAYEDALDRAGIPYVTVAGRGFYSRPEIRDILNGLHAIADPHDDLVLAGLLRSPAVGISDAGLFELTQTRPEMQSLWDWMAQTPVLSDTADRIALDLGRDLITTLHPLVGRLTVADLLKHFLDQTHYEAALLASDDKRAVGNVAKLLADAHGSGKVSVGEFLEYVTQLRDSGSREGEARSLADKVVQIMTIHQAKGLEFSTVVLGDINKSSSGHGGLLLDEKLGILLPLKDDKIEPALYQLAKEREKARDSAEAKRLLYVAMTRAENKLILNGQVTITSKGNLQHSGWLQQLTPGIGLDTFDASLLAKDGDRCHQFSAEIDQTRSDIWIYEDGWQPTAVARENVAVSAEIPTTATPLLKTLREPVNVDDQPNAPDVVWQVVSTSTRGYVPARVIGSIVHDALEIWRFPDPGFAKWVAARIQHYGINDPQQIQWANRQIQIILNRFQTSDLFTRIDSAQERYHELPYAYLNEKGELVDGIIDLLYLDADGWHIVDYKTDQIGKGKGVESLEKRANYEAQIRGYGSAVVHLKNEQPTLTLCFLNSKSGILMHPVEL